MPLLPCGVSRLWSLSPREATEDFEAFCATKVIVRAPASAGGRRQGGSNAALGLRVSFLQGGGPRSGRASVAGPWRQPLAKIMTGVTREIHALHQEARGNGKSAR